MEDQQTRTERFTMLEPKGPNTVLPGSEAWPVVEVLVTERFTMLEAKAPNNPSSTERPDNPEPLPAVQHMIAQLADAIGALEPGARAAAVAELAELTKRLAG